MNKLRQLCFYGALIVALGATYWFPVGNGFDSSPKSSLDDSKDEPHFRNAVESRSSTAAFQAIAKSAEWQPMTNTNDFCQAVNFWNDSKTLVVRNKEWNHLIDAWNFTYYEIRASFEISFVSGNGISDEFYVTGVARNGDSVIEHWKAVASIGSPFLSRTQFALPLGEPAGVAPSQGGFIGGG